MTGTAPDARETAARVEALLAELSRQTDPGVAARAEDLVATLVAFYGAGLARAVELLSTQDGGAALVRTLADDELVGSLLVLHDLHPDDTATRVAAALEKVRPYLGSHAGDVELLGVADDVVRLRLAGSCNGCPSSTVTVRLAIEAAIADLAPEVARVDVDGVVPEPVSVAPNGRPLLPVAAAGQAPDAATPGWVTVTDTGVPDGRVVGARVGGEAMVLCRAGTDTYAYRDRCPGCGGSLAGARLAGTELTCPRCTRTYDVRHAGRGDGTHLDPVPLLADGGTVRVAVPNLVAS